MLESLWRVSDLFSSSYCRVAGVLPRPPHTFIKRLLSLHTPRITKLPFETSEKEKERNAEKFRKISLCLTLLIVKNGAMLFCTRQGKKYRGEEIYADRCKDGNTANDNKTVDNRETNSEEKTKRLRKPADQQIQLELQHLHPGVDFI